VFGYFEHFLQHISVTQSVPDLTCYTYSLWAYQKYTLFGFFHIKYSFMNMLPVRISWLLYIFYLVKCRNGGF